jgi:hypothetical protein
LFVDFTFVNLAGACKEDCVICHVCVPVWRNCTVAISSQNLTVQIMVELVPGESVSIYEGSHMCGQEGCKEGIAYSCNK